MARDPFVRASRRVIRRLGDPVAMVDADGVPVEPSPKGIFSNPEGDRLLKGRDGGLVFKQRQPTLTVLTEDVPGLSKDWQLTIGGRDYYPADHQDDGQGCTTISLAVTPVDHAGKPNGSTWQ